MDEWTDGGKTVLRIAYSNTKGGREREREVESDRKRVRNKERKKGREGERKKEKK